MGNRNHLTALKRWALQFYGQYIGDSIGIQSHKQIQFYGQLFFCLSKWKVEVYIKDPPTILKDRPFFIGFEPYPTII